MSMLVSENAFSSQLPNYKACSHTQNPSERGCIWSTALENFTRSRIQYLVYGKVSANDVYRQELIPIFFQSPANDKQTE